LPLRHIKEIIATYHHHVAFKKSVLRRLERIASSCQTPAWMKERRIYRSLLRNKRESFSMRKIDAEKSSPRQLWRSIDVLLGRGGVPSCDNIDAQQVHDYFDAEVAGVRSSTDGASPPSFTTSSSDVHFNYFEPDTIDEVVAAVRVLPAALLIHYRLQHLSPSSMFSRLF